MSPPGESNAHEFVQDNKEKNKKPLNKMSSRVASWRESKHKLLTHATAKLDTRENFKISFKVMFWIKRLR